MSAPTAEGIERWLVDHVARAAHLDPSQVDPRDPFAEYGLDSRAAVGLSGDLEEWLGLKLPATLAWDYPTIELMARNLAERAAANGAKSDG